MVSLATLPIIFLSAWFNVVLAGATGLSVDNGQPTVNLQNGSYYGLFNPTYDQDLLLGLRYAEPPVGNLRFQRPRPLTSTWEDQRNETTYQPSCYNYPYPVGPLISGTDDCLTLNVVRPAGVDTEAKLPVAVWIHGGGLVSGIASLYNMSSIVDDSVKMGAPIIAVSITYRLHAWGFMWGSAMKAESAGNIGFRDQRQALHWIQENIPALRRRPREGHHLGPKRRCPRCCLSVDGVRRKG